MPRPKPHFPGGPSGQPVPSGQPLRGGLLPEEQLQLSLQQRLHPGSKPGGPDEDQCRWCGCGLCRGHTLGHAVTGASVEEARLSRKAWHHPPGASEASCWAGSHVGLALSRSSSFWSVPEPEQCQAPPGFQRRAAAVQNCKWLDLIKKLKLKKCKLALRNW